MSEVLYAITKSNKKDGYKHDVQESKDTLYSLTSNFIQELVTEKGSVLFDKTYGTTFIQDLGYQVNVYKARYMLENGYEDIKDKYGIISATVTDASFNNKDGFLELDINLAFEEGKVSSPISILYTGAFTEKTIIEVEK